MSKFEPKQKVVYLSSFNLFTCPLTNTTSFSTMDQVKTPHISKASTMQNDYLCIASLDVQRLVTRVMGTRQGNKKLILSLSRNIVYNQNKTSTIISKVGPFYGMKATQLGTFDIFKGGPTILTSYRVIPLVRNHETIVFTKVQFLTLELSVSTTIWIHKHRYGFNHSRPRSKLWTQMSRFKLPNVFWILTCDFKFVKAPRNKLHKTPTTTRIKQK